MLVVMQHLEGAVMLVGVADSFETAKAMAWTAHQHNGGQRIDWTTFHETGGATGVTEFNLDVFYSVTPVVLNAVHAGVIACQ